MTMKPSDSAVIDPKDVTDFAKGDLTEKVFEARQKINNNFESTLRKVYKQEIGVINNVIRLRGYTSAEQVYKFLDDQISKYNILKDRSEGEVQRNFNNEYEFYTNLKDLCSPGAVLTRFFGIL